MNNSPTFLLSVADGLVDAVAENTDGVLEAARRMSDREGFIDSLRGAVSGNKLVGSLYGNLGLAMTLCERASSADPSIKLENGETPSSVKAKALFQEGVIAIGQKRFKEAVQFFDQSLDLEPDQATYYNSAICFMQMKGLFRDRTQEAIEAFNHCIELNPETPLAILAGKELARLGRL